MDKPQKIGKYLVREVLGKGGMGIVYRAYDPILNRDVAIKMMVSSMADEELVRRFYREAQSLGKLQHPNIIKIYDLGQEGENPYLAMEFLTGTDLDKILKARQAMDLVRKLDIIRQVCDGLDCAHQAGIIHRDVKPANIRVLDDGVIKLMDFGIARISTSATMTRSGLIMGTVHYMSPEQIRGMKVDGRSDVFAVGAVLFELLTYRKPFHGETMTSVLYKIVNEPPPTFASLAVAVPPRLEQILDKALAKEITARYQEIGSMSTDLQELIDQLKGPDTSRQATCIVDRDRTVIEAKTAVSKTGAAEDAAGTVVEQLITEGRQLLQDGRFWEAQEAFERVNDLVADHEEAKSLADTAAREAQRQWVRQLIEQGKQLLNDMFFDEAVLRFREVLTIDADNSDAKLLIQTTLKRQEDEKRVVQSRIATQRREKEQLEKSIEYVEFGALTEEEATRLSMAREPFATTPPSKREPVAARTPPRGEPIGVTTPSRGGLSAPVSRPDELATPPPTGRLRAFDVPPARVPRLGPGVKIAAALGIVAFLIAIVVVVSIREPAPPPPPPPSGTPTGYVALTVLPWAQVDRVVDLASQKDLDGFQRTYTPCRLKLPAGRYTLFLTNPKFNPKQLQIEVVPNTTTPVTEKLDGYNRDQVIDTLLQ
ncbi:MAG: serine/threonine-protein kinase [Acidobacteriota bacterium]